VEGLKIAWLCMAGLLPQAALAQTRPALPGSPAVREALVFMQKGDFASAEARLRPEVAAHPDDPSALSLLGVALDHLKKISEAAEYHRRALVQAPHSISALSNYAEHEWIAGSQQEAGKLYLQVIALDPPHYRANVQLARFELQLGKGQEALRYLNHLPAERRDNPESLLLRLEASYLAGDHAHGDQLFARVSEMARSDLSFSFAAVNALSDARQYDKAEILCENALRAYPSNLNVLYDLGLMATSAGRFERAREVLDAAVRQQPQNVDVLYALARAQEGLKQWAAAVGLLARATKLDPHRADIHELLAVSASEMGAFEDAAAAWDQYLKLKPGDEIARRERSYTAVQMGQLDQGIAGLESFRANHADDATVRYELGQAERGRDAAKALMHFDKALELDPTYVPAWIARGSLYYQLGKPEAAVKDLETAAERRPDDAVCLDLLGQAYQALDRTADGVRVLQKAAEFAPQDSKTLLHFARALANAGYLEKSKAVMDQYRQLGPERNTFVPAGFVDYLNLTEAERKAEYRRRVEKALADHPDDADVRLAWMKLLIEAGDWNRVAETAGAIAALKPVAAVLANAGRALLDAKQYSAARELLQQAAAAAPSAAIQLELAIALFGGNDVAHALAEMELIPEPGRGGDYYLALAEMLRTSGKTGEAHAVFDQALALAPPQADFYIRAASFLSDRDQGMEAVRFLEQGARLVPGSREVLLLRAGALALVHRADDANHVLTDIQDRWPEWYPGWVIRGIVWKIQNRPGDARKALATASALGAPADVLAIDLKGLLSGVLFR
jgi:tetratricopeptide (TPR) repeat protein